MSTELLRWSPSFTPEPQLETSLLDNFLQKNTLPQDYTDFIKVNDGGVGFIGENRNYIDLWSVKYLHELNPYFEDETFSHEVMLIGSDGGGTFYGYDPVMKQYFETDQFMMTREEATYCGPSFNQFIKYLAEKKY